VDRRGGIWTGLLDWLSTTGCKSESSRQCGRRGIAPFPLLPLPPKTDLAFLSFVPFTCNHLHLTDLSLSLQNGQCVLLPLLSLFSQLTSSFPTSSEHIVNSPSSAVSDALQGLTYLNPSTEVYDTTLLLRSPSKDRVHLACGGGAGHEPAHAAFVGEGMLSAAVSGQVFASPNAGQVEKALGKLSLTKGVLLVTKVRFSSLSSPLSERIKPSLRPQNYTGDVLQFGLAKERWAASHLAGEETVKLVVVGDDVD
jgi:hypothetical protein